MQPNEIQSETMRLAAGVLGFRCMSSIPRTIRSQDAKHRGYVTKVVTADMICIKRNASASLRAPSQQSQYEHRRAEHKFAEICNAQSSDDAQRRELNEDLAGQ